MTPFLLLLGVAVFCDSPGRPYADVAGAHLPAWECRSIRGRAVDWFTAYATFNLAHEIGHLKTGCLGNGNACEDAADCSAAGHVAQVASLTGRTARQTRLIIRLAREGQGFGYRKIPARCWR